MPTIGSDVRFSLVATIVMKTNYSQISKIYEYCMANKIVIRSTLNFRSRYKFNKLLLSKEKHFLYVYTGLFFLYSPKLTTIIQLSQGAI